MNVNELMERDVGTCNPDTNLEYIAKIMWDKNCGSIPVLDNQRTPLGVITDRDIAMACFLNHKALWELFARDIVSNREVHCCGIDDDVRHALYLMSQFHVRRMPVVDREGHLAGMISLGDIVSRTESDKPDLNYNDTFNTLKQVYIHH
jgi:CBS domain-containing protein